MNNIEKIILQHKKIFHFFNEVYLFGSAINDSRYFNDIDLLLIYTKYSHRIMIEKKILSKYLEKLFKINIDITILSKEELNQTKFLDRLNSSYRKIK